VRGGVARFEQRCYSFIGLTRPPESRLCFLNAGLQALSGVWLFVDLFLSNAFVSCINSANELGMKGTMAHAFAGLLKGLRRRAPDAVALAPNEITSIRAFRDRFTPGEEHDAQELLSWLADMLHEDLSHAAPHAARELRDKGEGESDFDYAAFSRDWRRALTSSPVGELLEGTFKSELSCTLCRHRSLLFHPFRMVSLCLPSLPLFVPIVLRRRAGASGDFEFVLFYVPVTVDSSLDFGAEQFVSATTLLCKLAESEGVPDEVRSLTLVYSESADCAPEQGVNLERVVMVGANLKTERSRFWLLAAADLPVNDRGAVARACKAAVAAATAGLLGTSSSVAAAAAAHADVDIMDLLRVLGDREELDTKNTWKCPGCSESVLANKTLELWDLPEVLIVHFKRFLK
jgi:ubiquitin C-terminal hydrolase